MKTKLPNFLIVGAAKSGTTSLYFYLKEHPKIYMSPIKEPKFISSQFLKFPFCGIGDNKVEKNIIKDFDSYKILFEEVKDEKAIGEASADNLYFYEEAIPSIKKYLSTSKIIIILREPAERAFSQYLMFIRDSRECLSFEEALEAEAERKKMNWEFAWFYKNAGFYYHQVKAYLENFNQVKVYLFDDLKNDPLGLMKDLYKFLGVDSSFTPEISIKHNVSGIPKNEFFHYLISVPNPIKGVLKIAVKPFMSEAKRKKIIQNLKTKNLEKPKMNPETSQYLKDLYREDILKLQDLIGRDLSHWLVQK